MFPLNFETHSLPWIIGLAVVLALYQVVVGILLPGLVKNTGIHGDHDKAIRQLEFIARLPNASGDRGRILVLYHLGHRCLVARRYEESARCFERLLRISEAPPELMASIHGYYADCCEALGRADIAAQYRQQALTVASIKPGSYASMLQNGEQYERANHFDRACDTYELALKNPKLGRPQVNMLNAKLAVTATRAGRPETVVRAAEAVISNNPDKKMAGAMHRIAAPAFSTMGNLERAKEHLQNAYNIAESTKETPTQAEALAAISGIVRNQGNLKEALDMGRRAVALYSPPSRATNIHLYETLMSLGCYQEAWAVITGSSEQTTFLPHHQRAQDAVACLCLTRICLETGQFQNAWEYLQRGAAGFVNDTKMSYYIRSLTSAIQAELGNTDEAFATMRAVAQEMEAASIGRGSKLDAYSYLARTALTIGDHDDCLTYLEKYRDLNPYAADYPRMLYFAAESCNKVGNVSLAGTLYREAASICPESIFAERARARLGEG